MDLIQLYRLEAQPEVARASIATLIPFWCEHEGQLHLQDQLRNNHRNGFCCASIDVVTLSACQPPQLFDHPFNAALYQFPRMVLPIINASIHGSVLRRGSHVGGLVWTSIFDSSLADLVEPSAVTSSKVDRFVCICGLVTRVGPVRPQASSITYSCPQCFERILVYIDDGVWTAPKKCSRLQCNQKQFAPTRRTVTAKESQLLRLQKATTDKSANHAIDIHLSGPLVDCCEAGSHVYVCGVVRTRQTGRPDQTHRAVGVPKSSLHTIFLEANFVASGMASPGKVPLAPSRLASSDFWRLFPEAVEPARCGPSSRVQSFLSDFYQQEKDKFDVLCASLNPCVQGHEGAKGKCIHPKCYAAALMLSLLSGSVRPETPRTSIHLLLQGPPAVGKTLLLRSLIDASPRGLLITRNDASKTELTATVTKDVVTGDIQVDAGACVMASGGHCGIDDLCRSPAATALLEVMDTQCCTVSKAGSTCRLPAATAIVVTSRSTGTRDLVESTLPAELLRRFDLTFVLKNERHATPTAGTDLRSRIRRTSIKDLLPRELLTDLVFYASTQLHPILTTAARDAIRDLYVFLKSKSSPIRPVTVRVLETLVRLCKARARADLSELVTPQHVLDVEEVVGLSTLGDCEGFAFAGRKRKGKGLGSMLGPLQRQLRSVVGQQGTRVLSRALVLNVARDLVAVSEALDSAEQLVEAANAMGMLIKTSSDEFTVDVT